MAFAFEVNPFAGATSVLRGAMTARPSLSLEVRVDRRLALCTLPATDEDALEELLAQEMPVYLHESIREVRRMLRGAALHPPFLAYSGGESVDGEEQDPDGDGGDDGVRVEQFVLAFLALVGDRDMQWLERVLELELDLTQRVAQWQQEEEDAMHALLSRQSSQMEASREAALRADGDTAEMSQQIQRHVEERTAFDAEWARRRRVAFDAHRAEYRRRVVELHGEYAVAVAAAVDTGSTTAPSGNDAGSGPVMQHRVTMEQTTRDAAAARSTTGRARIVAAGSALLRQYWSYLDDGACAVGECDESVGRCRAVGVGDGQPCPDDGAACTTDECVGTICVHRLV